MRLSEGKIGDVVIGNASLWIRSAAGKRGTILKMDRRHFFVDIPNDEYPKGFYIDPDYVDLVDTVQPIPAQSRDFQSPNTLGATVSTPTILPHDAKERKKIPLAGGVLDYFTQALVEVAKVSYAGNEQHNPGQPLHWARGKSTDQADTMLRHFLERGTVDTDGMRHSAKMCWRALAILQLELEAEGAPVARGAKS
jgi:Domain of unknown function (DUF5664)